MAEPRRKDGGADGAAAAGRNRSSARRQDGGRSCGQRTTNVGTKDGDRTPWQDDNRLGHELERGRDRTTVGRVRVLENVTGSYAAGTVDVCEIGTSDVEVYAVVY